MIAESYGEDEVDLRRIILTQNMAVGGGQLVAVGGVGGGGSNN